MAEKSTTRNKEVIRHQEVHSTKFPINITGLTSEQRFIVMYGPEKFENEEIKIILLTNREKIKKKIHIKKYYLTPNQFMAEASKYCD